MGSSLANCRNAHALVKAGGAGPARAGARPDFRGPGGRRPSGPSTARSARGALSDPSCRHGRVWSSSRAPALPAAARFRPIAHSSPRAASRRRPVRVARTPRRMRSTSLSGIRTQSRSCVAPRRTTMGFLGDPVVERGSRCDDSATVPTSGMVITPERVEQGGEDERAVPGAKEARHSGGGSTPVRCGQRASGLPGASADRPTPRRGWPSRPSPSLPAAACSLQRLGRAMPRWLMAGRLARSSCFHCQRRPIPRTGLPRRAGPGGTPGES
jgi:hypothetical protein